MHPRYQTPGMDAIWGELNRNRIERDLWIAVLHAQKLHGLDIPTEAIEAYEQAAAALAVEDPDSQELAAIARIERETKHDLYARMRFFNAAAGHELIHLGLTSADIVENTQQLQLMQSAVLVMDHAEQLVLRLVAMSTDLAEAPIVARTHGQPAQLTTIGKRASDWLDELLHAMRAMREAHAGYMLRGIKGAVGTRADMAACLAADWESERWPEAAALSVDWAVVGQMDDDVSSVPMSLWSVGQNYPRSHDLPLASAMAQVVAVCGTICTSVRLLAMLGLGGELPGESQVGSSAMPHKINPRYSERVCSLQVVARGYLHMLQQLAGAQWFEGDVSTSAARRVALPGLCHVVDAVLANTAYVLDHLRFDRSRIEDEVQAWLPEVASGALLAAMVRAGVPRDRAHDTLRHHYRQIGEGDRGASRADALADSLGRDETCPLTREQVVALLDVRVLIAPAASIARTHAEQGEWAELLVPADPPWPGDLL